MRKHLKNIETRRLMEELMQFNEQRTRSLKAKIEVLKILSVLINGQVDA